VKHLAKALQRLGSGHKSRGVWSFLFFKFKSAPLAARKQAMEPLEDLFSGPCKLNPICSSSKSDCQHTLYRINVFKLQATLNTACTNAKISNNKT